MGAEGLAWVSKAPFSKRKHIFQNIGDGTHFHSGLLAVRAAVAAKTNITYKILFNDAVAMTGGQRHDGPLDVPTIAHQVRAEGVQRIAVVTDEPDKYPATISWPSGHTVHHPDTLNEVQKELREIEGTSVLIYDQTCAAEKRRRRKRGAFPDPAKRVVINDLVCEGWLGSVPLADALSEACASPHRERCREFLCIAPLGFADAEQLLGEHEVGEYRHLLKRVNRKDLQEVVDSSSDAFSPAQVEQEPARSPLLSAEEFTRVDL